MIFRFQSRLTCLWMLKKIRIVFRGPWPCRRSQRAVGGEDDAICFQEFAQLLLSQVRMALDLVHHRTNFTVSPQALKLSSVEVRDADALGKALDHKLLHFGPRFQVVDVREDDLSVRSAREYLCAFFVCERPVDQVKIDVGCAQVLQRGFQGRQYQVFAMRVAPQFACDENILTAEIRRVDNVQISNNGRKITA